MSEAIFVEGLGKKYRLGSSAHYGRLTETLTNAISYPFRKLTGRQTDAEMSGDIWALRNISFTVQTGDAIGIIGRNGAGKTTLLKILSRITEPTEGSALLRGRVGSLLEVGTGFHPELTGRENIYLNGAILGMSKASIRSRYKEIVEFSEIGRFIDTPVKKYSSGMTVRLAFAVAAHLEPEILIVDEVLAVGDVAFQQKCLGKMGDVASEGRTVLFVSHNMGTVGRLCKSGIWLDQGEIRTQGPIEDVISDYLAVVTEDRSEYIAEDVSDAPGDDIIRLRGVRVTNHEGNLATYVDGRQPIYIEIDHEVLRPAPGLRTGFRLQTTDGTVVFTSRDTDGEQMPGDRSVGRYTSRCRIPGKLLKSGQYAVTVNAAVPNVKVNFHVEGVISFWVEAPEISAEGRAAGVIAPHLEWDIDGRAASHVGTSSSPSTN